MKTHLGCVPCYVKQALGAIKLSTSDMALQRKAMDEVLLRLRGLTFDAPPAILADAVYGAVRDVTGVDDPYATVKRETNAHAMTLLPGLRKKIEVSEDPLHTAIQIALAGNIVDFGIDRPFDLERDVQNMLDKGFTVDCYAAFRERLAGCKRLLYLCDNSGEIAFDRLLIERLAPMCQVTASVKSGPIINDVTMEDARQVGITDIVPVIETGNRFVGVNWERSSEEFCRKFSEADLIIAKGQGNFETLNERTEPIFFLLMIKCEQVAETTGLHVGDRAFLRAPISGCVTRS